MQSAAPVVDHAKRSILGEIKASSPFNIFNIVALVAILVIGYFLYKKFNDKFQKGAINISPQDHLSVSKEPVSIVAQAAEVPPPADDVVSAK
jgi:hypothetical protein